MKNLRTVSEGDEQGVENSSTVAKGMLLMIFAMLVLPTMDAIAKVLSTSYDVTPAQMTFGRFFVQTIILGPIAVIFLGWQTLRLRHFGGNLLRGAIMGTAVLLFFTTLRYMPMADAIAVFFIEPFILTILSIIFLKETVGWRRATAMVVGFIGAIFIIQPSYEIFGPVSLMPVGTAILFAIYLLLTRKWSGDDDPITMQFISGLGGTLMLGAVMIVATRAGIENFSSPEIPEFGIRWTLIGALGILAAFGHLVVVFAFRMASASILAPFQYVEIVNATLLGFWLFGDFPDAWKWFGISLIIGSGIYLFAREARVAKMGDT